MDDILEKIMSTLKDSACSEAMLADKLCISTAELQACLKYLESMGYIYKSTLSGTELQEFCGDTSCNCSTCKGCSSNSFKSIQNLLIWKIN